MTSHYDFFATAPKYTEGLLLNEIKSLGAVDARETVGGVNFSGPLLLAYKTCLWSRIANRVLLQLRNCKISSPEDLYDACFAIRWMDHFDPAQTFVIDFNASGSIITHSQYGAQKCKDAIVDQFQHDCGTRPSVDKLNPSIRINAHVKNQNLTISLDLSGHSLHQRGYRKNNVTAPLKENLAAALLMRSNWPHQNEITAPLIDPMCGSGTIPIEAALIATNTAPGLFRTDFGFIHWKQHDSSGWEELRSKAMEQKKSLKHVSIYGFDNDQRAIDAAMQNADLAGVSQFITFKLQELDQLRNTNLGNNGYLATNAPYGERLSENQKLLPLYETFGRIIKQEFAGWHASLVTSDPTLAKATHLYARRKNKLYNGNLLCVIYHFDISEQNDRIDNKAEQKQLPKIDSDLANRLTKNIKRLNKWAVRQGVTCYRIYDADLPDYNFALDIYQSDRTYLVFQEYAAPSTISADKVQRRSIVARNTVLHSLDAEPTQLFYKQRKKQPGTDQYEKLQNKSRRHIVKENGCAFYVNFEDYLDTGLFLDHRMTRAMIQQDAKGSSFLNLFCYTGTASVYAAKGGARKTTSVDMSNTYLSWCEDNFRINEIPLSNHQFIKANCMDWLKLEENKYDLIFVDPPTFSNSKSMDRIFDVQRDYIELLKGCMELLADNGKIIFSTNFRKFRFDTTQFAGAKIEDITARTIPEDFARNRKIHQCWLITKN